jgi:hypothetical protein
VTQQDVFALNAPGSMTVQTKQIAWRRLAVVDGVYEDPDSVRRFALAQRYGPGGGLYPGRFARVALRREPIVELANRVLPSPDGRTLALNEAYEGIVAFAIPTCGGRDLSPLQQIPHADGFCDYAAVLYLSKPEDCVGGTSFWRHRRTGLEYAPLAGDARSAEQVRRYGAGTPIQLLDQMIDEALSEPIGGYITRSNENWELLDVVEMRPNRLVIYDANLFHSIYAPRTEWVPDLASPRLTQNLYVNWTAAVHSRDPSPR